MSVFDDYKREGEDNGGGFFLRNADFNETPRRFKFLDLCWREQKPETPEIFKTQDGRELFLTLEETIDGVATKRGYTAKGHKNALVIGMKQAGIEINDIFEATRKGEGIETRFTVSKVRDDGSVVVREGGEIQF